MNSRILARYKSFIIIIIKRVSRTLQKYPDIGTDIEEYACENRVGADSWRRTGVLTFTGNA